MSPARRRYWLVKSEPDVYSIDDLARDGRTMWDGVRNYQARNNMQAMKVGDEVLYYHSNAKPPGVVGIARVCKEAYPDHYAFDKKHKYFDAKSDAATDLVSAAEGFDSYGELTIHAVSWRVRGAAPETRRLGEDPKFVPLGEAFRTCERAQRNKYARLKSKAFKSLHKHVDGDFEPFVHADREKIPDALIERIRKINHLDVRLHAFAKKLFDERFEERRLDVAEEILPKALPL